MGGSGQEVQRKKKLPAKEIQEVQEVEEGRQQATSCEIGRQAKEIKEVQKVKEVQEGRQQATSCESELSRFNGLHLSDQRYELPRPDEDPGGELHEAAGENKCGKQDGG